MNERDENKNKFEKLKANRFQSKERSLFPSADKRFCLGLFAVTTWVTTMPVAEAISLSSLSFGGGKGEKGGCQIQSVINEHFKRPNCGR